RSGGRSRAGGESDVRGAGSADAGRTDAVVRRDRESGDDALPEPRSRALRSRVRVPAPAGAVRGGARGAGTSTPGIPARVVPQRRSDPAAAEVLAAPGGARHSD